MDHDDENKPRRLSTKSTFIRLWTYIFPFRWTMYAGVLCMVMTVITGLASPLVFRNIVDDLTAKGFDKIVGYVLILLGLLVGESFFGGLRSRLMHIAGEWFVLRIRKDAYQAVQRLHLSYFEQEATGDIMSRLSSDVEVMEDMFVHGTDDLLVNALRFFGIAGMLVYLDWRIALAVAIPAPIIAIGMVTFAKRIRKVYRKVRDQLGDLNAKLQDNVSGIRIIKSFATEDREFEQFANQSLDYANRRVQLVKLWTLFYPCVEFLAGLGLIAVVGLGVRLIRTGQLTAGEMVAALAYVMQFYGPIHSLSRINETIQRSLAAADRVFEMMDSLQDVPEAADAVDLTDMKGKVEFRNVRFSYASGGEVLTDVSLKAEPGQVVALVGRSGAGKTSIINLIPRFHDPVAGEVLLDDYDLRALKRHTLRKSIAIVLQDTFLFNGTVQENIVYAKPDATEEEILAASKASHAHEFIEKMAEGYATKIGERGVKLSGGQKQRLSIARALLANPRILILDEATSSVDTESEVLIHEALQQLVKGRTTFIIAHRLSTVQNADIILVMEDGRVVEEGDHNSLLKRGGVYSRMCEMQFALNQV